MESSLNDLKRYMKEFKDEDESLNYNDVDANPLDEFKQDSTFD